MNDLKVAVLLTALTALFVGVGDALGGQSGMLMAFCFAVVMNAGSYWFSDTVVLKMYRAQPISEADRPDLYRMVGNLCQRGGLPMPKLYLVDDPQPNAFATGRSPRHAAIAINTGLLTMLNPDEVEGVIAHELSHVKNRDTLTMSVVATLAGAIMMLVQIARFGMFFGFGGRGDRDENPLLIIALIIVAPLAATLIQLMVSRSREFEADAGSARLTGSPQELISALSKLERGVQAIPSRANPQTAHMFIVNPFGNLGGTVANLFRTHPSTADRIAALRALETHAAPNPFSNI